MLSFIDVSFQLWINVVVCTYRVINQFQVCITLMSSSHPEPSSTDPVMLLPVAPFTNMV